MFFTRPEIIILQSLVESCLEYAELNARPGCTMHRSCRQLRAESRKAVPILRGLKERFARWRNADVDWIAEGLDRAAREERP
jgi:hypothetical protein